MQHAWHAHVTTHDWLLHGILIIAILLEVLTNVQNDDFDSRSLQTLSVNSRGNGDSTFQSMGIKVKFCPGTFWPAGQAFYAIMYPVHFGDFKVAVESC